MVTIASEEAGKADGTGLRKQTGINSKLSVIKNIRILSNIFKRNE